MRGCSEVMASQHFLRLRCRERLVDMPTRVVEQVAPLQKEKLQASGVDLGSDMIFGTRLGFSGTPSNLLPMELRPCNFEPGSEAQIVRITTNPNVMHVREIRGWSVAKIIDIMRDSGENGHFNAMIDTGALITGMTNEEVCREVLKDGGASHVEVAIFLNSRDEKMVVGRDASPPYPLSRCGVALEKRCMLMPLELVASLRTT